MIDKTKNTLIQVKVSKLSYEFMKKYSSMFDISISRFCEMAINDKICSIDKIGDYTSEFGSKKKHNIPNYLEEK